MADKQQQWLSDLFLVHISVPASQTDRRVQITSPRSRESVHRGLLLLVHLLPQLVYPLLRCVRSFVPLITKVSIRGGT